MLFWWIWSDGFSNRVNPVIPNKKRTTTCQYKIPNPIKTWITTKKLTNPRAKHSSVSLSSRDLKRLSLVAIKLPKIKISPQIVTQRPNRSRVFRESSVLDSRFNSVPEMISWRRLKVASQAAILIKRDRNSGFCWFFRYRKGIAAAQKAEMRSPKFLSESMPP